MHPRIPFILATTVLLQYCAQPVTPTGGEKDTHPPIILKTEPPAFSSGVMPSSIQIHFDENVTIQNPENNITVSPLPSHKIKFITSNKKLSLEFENGSLEKGTTYAISLNEAISDLNEGNPGSYKPLFFSTADHIDSSFITAGIIYPDESEPKSLIVHSQQSDTGISRHIYTAKIINGRFQLEGLDTLPKNIIVFNDENNNKTFDSTEDLGVSLNILPGNKDTTAIKMYHRKKPLIQTFSLDSNLYLYGLPSPFIQQFLNKSTLLYSIKDTLFGPVKSMDSVLQFIPKSSYIISEKTDKKNRYLSYTGNIFREDTFINYLIDFNQSIITGTTDSIILITANDTFRADKNQITFSRNRITISLSHEIKLQKIIFPEKSLTFEKAQTNSIISIDYKVPEFGKIVLKNPYNFAYTGLLENKNHREHFVIEPESELHLSVPQGTYNALFFRDINKDHLITAPQNLYTTGEPYIKMKDIACTPTFENVIIIK